MPGSEHSAYRWLQILLFSAAILCLGYITDRSSFATVIVPFSVAFAVYFHWLGQMERWKWRQILWLALGFRLLLLVALPQLSDDYFRFIWDGALINRGIDPFEFLPSELQLPDMGVIYEGLNSKEHYSSYPTIMQWVFALSVWIGGEGLLGPVMVMRAVLIMADLVLIYFAVRYLPLIGFKSEQVIIYALNPLLIVEATGNLHFEGLMMAFACGGLAITMREKWNMKVAGVIASAAGILTKMTSLMLLPALLWKEGWGRSIVIGLGVLLVTAVGVFPFYSEFFLMNFGDSVLLYFRNFYFNPSLYGLVYNFTEPYIPHYRAEAVGPWMSLASMVCLVILILFRRAKSEKGVWVTALFILSIRLAFASTVHPWYVIDLLAVSLFTGFRFPVVASFMMVLSYHFYANGWEESRGLTFLSYVPVYAYAAWEMIGNRKQNMAGA